MFSEKSLFEKEGLHLEKERVLTYSKLFCPLGCKYCFAEDLEGRSGDKVSYLSEDQLNALEKIPPEISLIMLGCDTEFFQSKEGSLEILERLSHSDRDISIVTKMDLDSDFVKSLKNFDEVLNKNNKSLFVSFSIPCLDSAKIWEPGAPDPNARIESMKIVHDEGIKSFVAIRPLLPSVPDDELERIVDMTKGYSQGYYSGPLYVKNLDQGLVDTNNPELKIELVRPDWMPEGNEFYRIQKDGQMEFLRDTIIKSGNILFEGAADAIAHI